MKHTLIATIALLALSKAVVAHPEKADCTAILMSKAKEVLKACPYCPTIECYNPISGSPSAEEAELAVYLLSVTLGMCCPNGTFPECNTPFITPTIAIYFCGYPWMCIPCQEVADAVRPVLKQCEYQGNVDGIIRHEYISFAISKPPSVSIPCILDEM